MQINALYHLILLILPSSFREYIVLQTLSQYSQQEITVIYPLNKSTVELNKIEGGGIIGNCLNFTHEFYKN